MSLLIFVVVTAQATSTRTGDNLAILIPLEGTIVPLSDKGDFIARAHTSGEVASIDEGEIKRPSPGRIQTRTIPPNRPIFSGSSPEPKEVHPTCVPSTLIDLNSVVAVFVAGRTFIRVGIHFVPKRIRTK